MSDIKKYEKISDNIMLIANKLTLRMNVILSRYGNDNKRYFFHREVEYYSQKANMNLINIKRQFDYYLTIESMEDKDSFVMIGINDILKLRAALNESYKFFTDTKYENLYVKNDGELIILQKVEPIIITDLPMGKYLKFEPSVYTDFRGDAVRGLRMYINNNYYDISINRLAGFKYVIDSINLFESAQTMLNYIEAPIGMDIYSFNTELEENTQLDFQGKDERVPSGNQSRLSYFDKMKNLE